MCLLLHKPAGVKLSDQLLRTAMARCKDGIGVLIIEKATAYVGLKTMDYDKAMNKIKANMNNELVLHFRQGTGGTTDDRNIHPFRIGTNGGLWIAHNGHINVRRDNPMYCDTWHFAKILEQTIEKRPKAIRDPMFWESVHEVAGAYNKLIVVDRDYPGGPRVWRIGDMKQLPTGIWVSNEHTFNGPEKWMGKDGGQAGLPIQVTDSDADGGEETLPCDCYACDDPEIATFIGAGEHVIPWRTEGKLTQYLPLPDCAQDRHTDTRCRKCPEHTCRYLIGVYH